MICMITFSTKCEDLMVARNSYRYIHIGKDVTSMLLTQALQPLGCDGGPPAGKYPVFDLEFSPKVWKILRLYTLI